LNFYRRRPTDDEELLQSQSAWEDFKCEDFVEEVEELKESSADLV
jgi:hypothetical protein